MNLYRKQLNSLEELKREKLRLRYESLQTKASDLNPIAEMGNSRKAKSTAVNNFMGLAMSLLGSGSNADRALKIAPFLLKLLSRKSKSKDNRKGKSILQKIGLDILVCYAIGKGLQMGIRGLKMYLKSKKRKKAAGKESYRPGKSVMREHW